ncbi:MAG: class I tRNA ligase family protein, partial [Muribaculaceae bacterium]|nr:class I tRNA ligase family protein [Muribaculaceae bacterium]
FGSDPVRWYMIATSSPWDDLKYDPDGVKEVARKFFATLSNTYNFFAMYANVDGFTGEEPQVPVASRPEIDRWVLSLLNTLVKNVTEGFENYEPTRAARAISEFIDELSNWYVRLNRKRFWGGEMNADKLAAYQTLRTCLDTVARLMAPIAPFFSDRLFRDLNEGASSVHLADFPKYDPEAVDSALEEQMSTAQRLTSLVLSLRKKANLKVRQPLLRMLVPAVDAASAAQLQACAPIVKTEVNVKELQIVAPDNEVFVKRVDPDFKKLGPKFGKMMKQAAALIKSFSPDQIRTLEREGFIDLDIDGTVTKVDLSDVKIISEDMPGWLVANEGSLTVALDIYITPELLREGLARDIINRIQRYRKEMSFDITDHINVLFLPADELGPVLEEYGGYIAEQVLADSISIGDPADGQDVTIFDIDDLKIGVVISHA